MEVFAIVCPEGVGPGAAVTAVTPSGRQVQVQVPAGVGPGMQFQAQVPMAQGLPPPMMQMGGGNAFEHLKTLPRIEVREKVRMVEAITALLGAEINMANKYEVVDPSGQQVFFVSETTDCCTQQLKNCCPDCVPWDANILYTYGGQATKFLRLHREATFTCCCFNRPTLDIIDESTGQNIGSLRDPCACCDLTFEMKDPQGEDVLFVKGGCCQLGLICPCPFGPCSEVNFDIQDAKSGSSVGHMTKTLPGCCQFLFSPNTENYEIDFQEIQNPQWKALVMALSIFVDFRYFNTSQKPNDGPGPAGFLGAILQS